MDVRGMIEALRNNPYVKGKSLNKIFPQSFLDRHPYHNVENGCCIQCGRQMRQNEMEPLGKSPRAICPECYAKWTREVTKNCPICGDYLPNHKVQAQSSNPQEVSLRIHDGSCLDYFSIISCKVLYEDLYFLRDAYDMVKKGLRDRMKVIQHQLDTNVGDRGVLSKERQKCLVRYGSLQLRFDNQDEQQIGVPFPNQQAYPNQQGYFRTGEQE